MNRDLNSSLPPQNIESIPNPVTILRLEQAHELLSFALLSNFIYAISVLIYTYEMNFEGNMKSVIYCIFSKLLLQILHQCHYCKVFRNLNVKYCQNIIRIIQLFLECCFVAMINVFIVNKVKDLLLIANIFLALNILLALILKVNQGNSNFKYSVQQVNLFYVFRNISLFLISIFITLRLGNYYSIDWVYALWVFWILFSLSGSLTFYYIFVILALCIQVILEQNNRQKHFVIINIWILFFMISSSCMLFLVPISIMHYYAIGHYDDLIEVIKILLIVNQIIFSYFTVKFKPELLNWLSAYLSQNDLVSPHQTLQTQQDLQLQQTKQNFVESQPSEIHIQIPKVVKRISKTFFGFDEEKSDQRPDTAHRQPTHHKAFSSQIQRCGENEKIRLTSLINLKFSDIQNNQDSPNDEQKKEEEKKIEPPPNQSFSISSVNSCCICYDNEPNAIFMKCGHGGICYKCAIDMWKNNDECYLCRNKIHCVLQISQLEKQRNLFEVITATEMNKKEKLDVSPQNPPSQDA